MSAQLSWTMHAPDRVDGRESGDPLGFRAAGARVARSLVPGITQRTSMIRGFSLLCLGLELSKKVGGAEADTRFQVFERLVVAGQVVHHGSETPFAGKRAAIAYLQLPRYPLRSGPILSQQLSSGMWGTYRTASSYFGLVRSEGRSRRSTPQFARLTEAGRALANEAGKSVFGKNFPISKWLAAADARPDDLMRVGRDGHRATSAEARLLSQAVDAVDGDSSRPLGILRSRWTTSTPLDLASLAHGLPAGASEEQRNALNAAVAIERLGAEIEAGYRRWVTGQDCPPLRSNICAQAEWATVVPYSHDLSDLLDALRNGAAPDRWDVVHAHQQRLAGLRGGRPWDRTKDEMSAQTRGIYQPYDFALRSLNSLFSEGLLG